jgi:hypothetical protein
VLARTDDDDDDDDDDAAVNMGKISENYHLIFSSYITIIRFTSLYRK